MNPVAFSCSYFCCRDSTKLARKRQHQMGEQFSADYSVYYLRFLATYVYYMQLTVGDSPVRV